LARCDLDLRHPKFRRAASPALEVGLNTLRNTVAKDHKLSRWVNHPMPGYPLYQNKIWKWDFAPEGDRSSTRKGWRLYAYVPDPKATEPIPATAFLCYDKAAAPSGDHTLFVAKAIKKFLTETIEVKTVDSPFRRQVNGNGEIISLCENCCELVLISADVADVDLAEGTHQCTVGDIAAVAEE
jgi:hypothetical protein